MIENDALAQVHALSAGRAARREAKFARRLERKVSRFEARLGRPSSASELAEIEERYGRRITLRELIAAMED